MTSALAIPVRSLILTALGAGLAVGWYGWSHTGVNILAAVSVALPLAVQVVGVGLIKQRPALDMRIIELRAVAIAVASAALGAAATIIGIELAAPKARPNPTRHWSPPPSPASPHSSVASPWLQKRWTRPSATSP